MRLKRSCARRKTAEPRQAAKTADHRHKILSGTQIILYRKLLMIRAPTTFAVRKNLHTSLAALLCRESRHTAPVQQRDRIFLQRLLGLNQAKRMPSPIRGRAVFSRKFTLKVSWYGLYTSRRRGDTACLRMDRPAVVKHFPCSVLPVSFPTLTLRRRKK